MTDTPRTTNPRYPRVPGYTAGLPPRRLKVGDRVTYAGQPLVVTSTEGSYWPAEGDGYWLVTARPEGAATGGVCTDERHFTTTENGAAS